MIIKKNFFFDDDMWADTIFIYLISKSFLIKDNNFCLTVTKI